MLTDMAVEFGGFWSTNLFYAFCKRINGTVLFVKHALQTEAAKQFQWNWRKMSVTFRK